MSMFDLALVSANAFSALAVTLMIFVIKTQIKTDKRVSRVESDLYIDPENPAKEPLTKQVSDLADEIQKLNNNIVSINNMITEVYHANCK